MATATTRSPIRIGDRVVATRDLPGVPEGTGGVVKVVNGLTWTRYWVAWADGSWMGSVSGTHVVHASEWDEFRRRREEERARPPEPVAAAGAPATAGDAGADAGASPPAAASKIPAHLLERSQKARERKADSGG